jgi:4-amino-4-deoxy-L-arabinose transferase-like glycosyltransferase
MEKASNRTILILAAILFLAVLLRIPGLFWGYDLFGDGRHYVLNPDERYHATIAAEFFEGVDYSQYYVRGLGNQIAVVFWLGRFLVKSLELSPQYLYAIGRLLALLYSLATIILIYFFSGELFEDQTVSLLSSLFWALSWIHVAYGRIGLADIPALFWMYASFYFALRYLRKRDDAYLLLASIGAGFSIGTKPNPILFVPLLLILIASRRKLYHGLLVLFALIGSFELINAFSYTPQSYLNTRYKMLSDSFSGVEVNKLVNIPSYLLLLLPSLGLPVFLLSVWGVVKLFGGTERKGLGVRSLLSNKYFLVIAPMLLHFYLICRLIVNFTRYLLPVVPLLAVFAAYGLVRLIDGAKSPGLFKGVVAAIIVYQLVQIASLERAAVFDSRKLMGDWMKKNISTAELISTGPSADYNLVPSAYTTTADFDADYIVLHSCFYSRYLTGGYGFRDSYPSSCNQVFHCWGGEPTRRFIQDLFRGKTDYRLLKKFEISFITPEMLLMKYLFGPRVDGYGSYTGDTVIFGRSAGLGS